MRFRLIPPIPTNYEIYQVTMSGITDRNIKNEILKLEYTTNPNNDHTILWKNLHNLHFMLHPSGIQASTKRTNKPRRNNQSRSSNYKSGGKRRYSSNYNRNTGRGYQKRNDKGQWRPRRQYNASRSRGRNRGHNNNAKRYVGKGRGIKIVEDIMITIIIQMVVIINVEVVKIIMIKEINVILMIQEVQEEQEVIIGMTMETEIVE